MIARVQSYTEVYTDNIQLGNRNANKEIKKIKSENLVAAVNRLGPRELRGRLAGWT